TLEGTLKGNSIYLLAKDEQGGTDEGKGTLERATITGTIVFTHAADAAHPQTHKFTAELVPARRTGTPQRHEFVPATFYRQFSAANKPVLTIAPGDSVHTTTVDAGGMDEKGVARVLGGNPETGPFYVQTAAPGDTLVVHLTPLRPMLGCVAVAPNVAQAAPGTGDSGRYGGNMDFNEIVEGATVYLPVSVPGALLYVGDGHALQGDGELNGNALETSMDVEF